MARKSRHIKAGEEPPWPKEEKTSLAWLGIPAATLREWHRAREALEPVLDKALARVLQRAQGLPRSREEQEEDFAELRIPPAVYGKLWEWGASPEGVEPVLRFLERVKLWREERELTVRLGRLAHGRARDPHYKKSPEEPGEIAAFLRARKDLIFPIVQALTLHYKTTHAYDPAIASAASHLEATLNYLKQWPEIEVDPTLPNRKRGPKPGPKMVLNEGETPRQVKQRDIERALKKLLLPLHPDGNKFKVKQLSNELLKPILE